ncbi:MAG: hypothetical protein RR214_03375, partial [Synergistaceae bacterium]
PPLPSFAKGSPIVCQRLAHRLPTARPSFANYLPTPLTIVQQLFNHRSTPLPLPLFANGLPIVRPSFAKGLPTPLPLRSFAKGFSNAPSFPPFAFCALNPSILRFISFCFHL